MAEETTQQRDWRYEELRRLGEKERRMVEELTDVRDAIAQRVKELLPQHSSTNRIHGVVRASGYSRTLIEALRGGKAVWSKHR